MARNPADAAHLETAQSWTCARLGLSASPRPSRRVKADDLPRLTAVDVHAATGKPSHAMEAVPKTEQGPDREITRR